MSSAMARCWGDDLCKTHKRARAECLNRVYRRIWINNTLPSNCSIKRDDRSAEESSSRERFPPLRSRLILNSSSCAKLLFPQKRKRPAMSDSISLISNWEVSSSFEELALPSQKFSFSLIESEGWKRMEKGSIRASNSCKSSSSRFQTQQRRSSALISIDACNLPIKQSAFAFMIHAPAGHFDLTCVESSINMRNYLKQLLDWHGEWWGERNEDFNVEAAWLTSVFVLQ